VRSWVSEHNPPDHVDNEEGPLVIHPDGETSRLPPDHEVPGSDGREPVYATREWEAWARMQARHAAAEAAADHVTEATDINEEYVSHGSSSGPRPDESVAVVTVRLPEDHERIPPAEVATVTPATVDTTYRLDGREFHHEAPVYVRVQHVDDIDPLGLFDFDVPRSSVDRPLPTVDSVEGMADIPDDEMWGGSPAESPASEDVGDDTDGETHGNGADGGIHSSAADDGPDSDTNDGTDDTGGGSSDGTGAEGREDDSEDGFGPGLGPGAVLTGLGGLGYLARRRLTGGESPDAE